MKPIPSFLLAIFFISQPPTLAQAPLGKLLERRYASLQDESSEVVLVYIRDKGNVNRYRRAQPRTFISDRAVQRRSKVRSGDRIVDHNDFPLERSYVGAIAHRVLRVRHELRWFNAVSVVATKKQIEQLRLLPFVKEIELVGRWRVDRSQEVPRESDEVSADAPFSETPPTLDYGTSFTQVNQIKVPAVHDLGIYGQGVVVAVFDNGFRLPSHESFASMDIIATYDFVDKKESVVPYHPNHGRHGVNVLSTVGGFKPGQLIGPAFRASYILARTENDSSETPIEEDNWARGIEWADSIGVDVATTSLGYVDYDPPYPSWTWGDMDGNTTIITRAADRAVGLGIVVLNSAGNSGLDPSRNTLVAPADGDSVIAVGAVTSTGVRSSFSSVGPTTSDPPRIKPDVMAMGSGVKVASSLNSTGYGTANGTSFSCPLAAGVAALVLSANPTLTPMQVRDAMRQTASNAGSPNNQMGWGILNADSALKYFGILPEGRIRGFAYDDINGNGVRDDGEPALPNVSVHLGGPENRSTVTDAAGYYEFDSLPIGNFTVSTDLPSGWMHTSPAGGSHTMRLLFRKDTMGVNFGHFRRGSIHGIVWLDENSDGVRDPNEQGFAEWPVKLIGPDTVSTLTDSTGGFSFLDLGSGVYTVRLQTGLFVTSPTPPGIHEVVISSGTDASGIDFGVKMPDEASYLVASGWNLLSLPLIVDDRTPVVVYPGAASRAFAYDGIYQALDTLPTRIGYWLKFAKSQRVTILGTGRLTDTIDVREGWNLIGSLSSPVAKSSVLQIPEGIVQSSYFHFDDGYDNSSEQLEPHKGYFVRCSSAGKLVLDATASAKSIGTQITDLEAMTMVANSLTIVDATGRSRRLTFGEGLDARVSSELPPIPPADAFDIRFENNTTTWNVEERLAPGYRDILMQGHVPPMTIKWKISPATETYSLVRLETGKHRTIVVLRGTGSITLDNTTISHLRLGYERAGALGNSLPTEFQLGQNYPNPFNPSTVISYDLPVESFVSLKILNVLGQEVITLVEKRQEAGSQSIEWDAGATPSGVYFYKMSAGSFSATRKMLLVR